MYNTTDFKKGLKVEYRDSAWSIVAFQHVNPGKGSAFVRTKLKNLETGNVLELNFKAGVDKLGVPNVEQFEMQYLYFDGEKYNFMNNTTFDQVTLTDAEVGEAKFYLLENSMAKVTYYKNRPVAIEVDNFVNLPIAETQPNIKGDTSGGGGKPAITSTGLTVTVPFHLNVGDIIKIDTRDNSYLEKVK
jgi:elongation factor P